MLIIGLQLQRPLNQSSKSRAGPEFRFLTEAILFHVNIPIHVPTTDWRLKDEAEEEDIICAKWH